MCGRFTARYTWAEVHAYYRLIQSQPPSNMQPRFNVCPTTTIDAVTHDDDRPPAVSSGCVGA